MSSGKLELPGVHRACRELESQQHREAARGQSHKAHVKLHVLSRLFEPLIWSGRASLGLSRSPLPVKRRSFSCGVQNTRFDGLLDGPARLGSAETIKKRATHDGSKCSSDCEVTCRD